MTMKRSLASAALLLSAPAFGYTGNSANNITYAEGNGYVWLLGEDGSADSQQSWTGGYLWPGGAAPDGDHDYYVSHAWRRIAMARAASEADALPFAGRSLHVACDIFNYGAYGQWVNFGDNVTLLGGCRFMWNSIGNVTGGTVTLDNCSAAWPVYFSYFGRSEATPYNVRFNAAVRAGHGACLLWQHNGGGLQMGANFLIGRDWPEFFGTLAMSSTNNTFMAPTFSTPGNVVVTNDAKFLLTAASGTSTLGGLSVAAGTAFGFSAAGNVQTVTVTGRLDFAAGSTFIGRKFTAWENGAPPVYPVFTLSPEAVAAGVPDMAGVTYDFAGVSNPGGGVPKMKWVATPLEGGGAALGVTYGEIVTVTNNMTFASTPFYEDGLPENDPVRFLSDGQAFHGGVDYYAQGKNLVMRALANPCVFRGDSLTLDGCALALYGGFTCGDLTLYRYGRFRMMTSTATYELGGGITLMRDPDAPGRAAWRFAVGNRSTYRITAALSGGGGLEGLLDPEDVNSIHNWRGGIELCGDNTAWSGRITLHAGKAGDFKAYYDDKGLEPYVPGPASNVTLTVHTQANLGGPLPAFEPNALCVSNHCRVVLAETATFGDMTRGWSFPQTAYLKVPDGAAATVMSPVTYGIRLVKEGAGALLLGSAPRRADAAVRPVLEVAEGAVGVAATNALAGLDVTFAAGTGLHVPLAPEDADVLARGAVLTDVGITAPDGITVSFGAEALPASGVADVAIATVDSAAAETFAAKLKIVRIGGSRITVRPVPNADGTTTFRARIAPAGIRISFR